MMTTGTGLATSPAAATTTQGTLGGTGPAPGTIFVADPGVVNSDLGALGPGSVSLYRPGASSHARPEVVITKGLAGPVGIAVDSSGNLWVANMGGDVVEYSRAELAKASPAPTVSIAESGDGLAFDASGDLWVSAAYNVFEYGKAQLLESGLPTPVFTLNEDDCSLSFDASGDLWEGSMGHFLSEWPKGELPKVSPPFRTHSRSSQGEDHLGPPEHAVPARF